MKATRPKIVEALRGKLRNGHLLVREAGPAGEEQYSCHPVLRDHFRQVLLGRGREIAGEAAAVMLVGQPLSERPKSGREHEPVLAAIELLLEAGYFFQADGLYRGWFENGELFKRMPALDEGLRCVLGFVGTLERRAQCEHQLSIRRLAFYLSGAGLCALLVGEVRDALSFFQDSLDAYRGSGDTKNVSIILRNQSELYLFLGRLGEAEAASREALLLAEEIGNENGQEDSWASLGAVLSTAGRILEATSAFDQANTIAVTRDPNGEELYSAPGIMWADLLLRLGRSSRARQLTESNLKICLHHGASSDIARCRWILGRIDTTECEASAGEHLATAESTLRRGHVLMDLPPVLLAAAELHARQSRFDEALQKAEEALRIAAPRELRLHHADALVARGRILLALAQALLGDAAATRRAIEKAQDDSEAGLALAKECGYAWAERDALRLLSETTKALGDPARSKTLTEEVRALERQLLPEDLPPDPPHARWRAKSRQ